MDNNTVLLVGVATGIEVKLREALPDLEWRALDHAARSRDLAKGVSGSTAIVALDGDAEAAFRMVGELDRAGARVIVVGPIKEADLILRAMREGAKEFVLATECDALAQAVRQQTRPQLMSTGGKVYSIFSAKGGVGATTIAVNVAGVMQARGRKTCIVDLNLNMGDVLAFLDLAGGYSISDVVANMRRLDRELLDATLLKHASGIHVLSQSHRVEDSDQVAPAMISGLLHFLRQHYDCVIVDGLRSFDDISVAAVDASDRILLVLTQEVPAVRDARRSVALFRRLGHEEKLRVVVNRYQRHPQITADVIAETVGLPVTATVTNDYPSVVGAINRGVLLTDGAAKAQVTRDIEAVVNGLAPAEDVDQQSQRPSLLKRIFATGGARR